MSEMVTQHLGSPPESTHEAVLLHLKRSGEMTVAELCSALDITSMAVRRHLVGLQNEGLVASRIVKQSRGRPTYRYRLTDKAESLFPQGFQNLALDILDAVFDQGGHKAVNELLALRNERSFKRLSPRVANMALGERVAEVAKIYSESGFMTEWQALPDGNFIIFQRHCAVHNLATQYRQLCGLEPKLIERLLGFKVSRQHYILNDDPVCSYLVHADQPLPS